mmetsp:Transcript_50059/g.131898  ORF Transcript_50059/g.131898 Transcript_50059/m.131898 type:complete len:142 (-) Transcript_50059:118-543(-)|eukprot:CAMPEP_0115281730 /NCGR_PEP_ID=MMETSP0270-20121206/59472_1 /TAXON_ID=71861 /ORGANISM="Scrippsiella trochoidea, Strain CCMP3099" /LENGTH=141 /DNA_ID=CAMNT_0002698543 /DNA_START=62 /DNA_END=487 /DNA_ORIENTATION=+
MAAPQLIWECVKRNSSFIRKSRNMPTMSAEPGNLCGVNSYKFSGIANEKVFNLSTQKTGQKETILMTVGHKKASRSRRPASLLLQSGVKKQSKKGLAQIAKATAGSFYRRDLLGLAEAKFNKIKTSFKKKKVVVKSRRAGK